MQVAQDVAQCAVRALATIPRNQDIKCVLRRQGQMVIMT